MKNDEYNYLESYLPLKEYGDLTNDEALDALSPSCFTQPCATFLVPNRSSAYPDVNIVGKAMLPNVLASSSKEELENLLKDALTAKLNLMKDGLSSFQLFEIWCKLYDRSYSSQQEKQHRLTVIEDNLKILMDNNKWENEEYNKGANTLTLYNTPYKYVDLTPAETNRVFGLGYGISDEKMNEYSEDVPVMELRIFGRM